MLPTSRQNPINFVDPSVEKVDGRKRFALPEEYLTYVPPVTFPPVAQTYLRNLAKVGSENSARILSKVTVKQLNEWRQEIEGFEEEETSARESLIETLEGEGFQMVFTSQSEKVRSEMIRFFLERLNRTKYGKEQKVELSGEVGLSWVDLMNQGS